MAPKLIKVAPADVQEKAQTVATTLEQAAQPGPIPVAVAGSPIDTALAAVATAVADAVADASGEMQPRATMGLAESTQALQQLQGQDAANAGQVAQVPEGQVQQAALSSGGAPAAANPGGDMLGSVPGAEAQPASAPMQALQSVGGMASGAGQIPSQMAQMGSGAFGQLQHESQQQDPPDAAREHEHRHHPDGGNDLPAPSDPTAAPGNQDLSGQRAGDLPAAPGADPGTVRQV
jgi:hypothetical protein